MTALPEHSPEPRFPVIDEPLTIAEYLELGEPRSGYTELIEGSLLMSPSPKPRHNIASGRLYIQLTQQVPDHLEPIQDLDIDLQLNPPDQPGFSRRPDLVVVNRKALDRVDADGDIIRADEVLVVVEIVSPGSHRIDRVHKRGEYADAGIPHYWIVDLDKPVSLVACHLTEEFGYRDAPEATGMFTATDPFPVQIDLNALR
ncbi:Uma2 family endonuclease [Amycolatopsis anabasis]|uniref:Uma2 family endonuclease n=1 Tax=Amycolatopsis anabasis TaxID=1840409 RepID=UPI00131ABC95|nr:Uma2 family endonuclease [Amycolatopsis anabasis]